MTGLLPKMSRGMRKYLKTKTVPAAAGLHKILHYVQVRRASIMHWIVDRPILEPCRSVERGRGTTPRNFWWEQSMDLDETRGRAPLDVVAAGNRGERGRPP